MRIRTATAHGYDYDTHCDDQIPLKQLEFKKRLVDVDIEIQ